MEPATLTDKKIIAWQLGRRPRGLTGIAARCPHGYPQVVVVYPLVDGKPFPTTYWLTCPFLQKEIDHLEAQGMIKVLEARIRTEPELAQRFGRAHRDYIAARLRLLSQKDRIQLEQTGMLAVLTSRGIGGTADFTRVKCLHMHVAHALVASNPIGELVLNALPQQACPKEHVICAAVDPSVRSPVK